MIARFIIAGGIISLTISLLVFAQQMPQGATLRGRVIYEETGLPVRRAWIGLELIRKYPTATGIDSNENTSHVDDLGYLDLSSNSNALGYSSGFVLTGDNGEYVFKDILPGEYYAVTKQPGIRNPTLADINNPAFQKIVITGTDEIKQDISIVRGGSIVGTIRYQDGSVVPGAKVELKRIGDGEFEEDEKKEADDRGVYRFAGLEEGEYIISVSESVMHSAEGEAQSPDSSNDAAGKILVYFGGTYSAAEATPVAVRLSTEVRNIDITIPNHIFYRMSGRVVEKNDGTPVEGASIAFKRIGEQFDWYQLEAQTLKTDPDGGFEFKELLAGKYEITVDRPSGTRGKKDGEIRKLASIIKKIEITDQHLENIQIELPFSAGISGTVVSENMNAPEGTLWVYVESEKSISSNLRPVVMKGGYARFALDDLPPGEYLLNVHSMSGQYVKKVTQGGSDITNGTIVLEEGETIEGVEIHVAANFGTVEGRITNQRIPSGRYIYLVPVQTVGWPSDKRYEGRAGQIESNGRFSIHAKPGKYWVVTRKLQNFDDSATFEERKRIYLDWVEGAEMIEVQAGETIVLNMRLDK